jgi:hypothetical protein
LEPGHETASGKLNQYYKVIQQHRNNIYSLQEPTGATIQGKYNIEQLKPVDRHVKHGKKKNNISRI